MIMHANELQRLLLQRELHIHFQPIMDTRAQRILGYEALVRGPVESVLHSATALFTTARHAHMLAELEYLCRELAIQQFVQHKLPGKLFLNVSPLTLTDPRQPRGETLRLLEREGLSPSRVVIELSEHDPTPDMDLLARATRHYAGMGFEIAIDDLGAGYSGLRLWSEVTPGYVKIDRHFVEKLHQDRIKREFVRFIRDIAERLGCHVIAEGIEEPEEAEALQALGLHLQQGYLLGRPAPAFTLATVSCDSATPAEGFLAPAGRAAPSTPTVAL
ncbi:MAG TPA: EAL domain-containing protein [Moraxellaceae bacterium]|nr:EAL domain-containing protein [Moraxellaceae bacterium]